MALQFLRLRRAVSSLTASRYSFSASVMPLGTQTAPRLPPCASSVSSSPNFSFSQSRGFTGTRVLLEQERKYKVYQDGDEITEDTVLFPGCDFNHWLITVNFPREPVLSPQEMVATYERICAQGLGISVEEAKKKIYACSTTTYQGFQAIMTEKESDKFLALSEVVFVLPDSYIDPGNEEYGGDKYENGVVTHRPPPVTYQRNDRSMRGRRYGQQGNPQYQQQRDPQYNQQWNPQHQQQGNPQYDQQGNPHHQQQRNPQYNPQGNPDLLQQGYSPQQQQGPMQGDNRINGPPQNFPSQQQSGTRPQQNIQNYPPQQNFGPPRNNYYGTPQQNYPPGQMPMNSRDSQVPGGNHYPPTQGAPLGGDQKNYGPTGQRDPRGDGSNYPNKSGGNYGQGANIGSGQGYPGEGQAFSQMGQMNTQDGRVR